MKLSRREKRMLVGGAIVVVAVIIVNWIIAPLGRKWAEMGGQLAPRLMLLEAAQSRAERYGSLLARRDHLSRQVGSLLGSAQPKESQKNDAGKPPGPPTGHSERPETPQTAEDGPRSIEVELEKIAGKSGVKLKLVSAKRTPRQAGGLKHFRMTALRIEADTDINCLMKMVHALEKGNRFIRIDALKIHQDLKKPGALNLTMEIVAYAPADEA